MCWHAPVAQWIEHRIPVPRVGGSSPFRCTKNSRYPFGCLEFFICRGRDSNDSMQRGRALPAAAGRSGTFIFAYGENANESLPVYAAHRAARERIATSLWLLAMTRFSVPLGKN